MKKQRLFRSLIIVFTTIFGISLFAQEEIILDPSTMEPADTGYYIGGVWKDLNEDGVDEFYNGCVEEFGDASHNEAGIQQGFTYHRCMIMPDCWPKDAVDDHTKAEIDHAEGYIQLTKTKYIETDSAVLGYLITPPFTNLVSLTLEVSTDNTRTSERPIDWRIEYSKDNGETWENAFILDGYSITDKKYGEEHFYDGSVFLEFEDMKAASQESPIVLRIMTRPEEYKLDGTVTLQGQRIRVHYITIVADAVSSINSVKDEFEKIRINDNTISIERGTIEVYNTLGQFMGSGEFVCVQPGIYVVRTENGATQKVLVK